MEVSINGEPQNGWFKMEHPIKMDGFGGIPIYGNPQMEPKK